MRARTTDSEQLLQAIEDLVALGRSLAKTEIADSGPGLVTVHRSSETAGPTAVVAREAVNEGDARQLVAERPGERHVVVANRITEAARDVLCAAGWSWLDRRYGAHIADPVRPLEVLFVERPDRTSAGGPRTVRFDGGLLRGRADLAYAIALLLADDDPRPSMRAVASSIGMSPTSLSNAARHLRDAGLMLRDGSPAMPDLFDAVAAAWGPLVVVAVATQPRPQEPRLDTNVANLAAPGWALGGDAAAAALGAPVVNMEERPVLWVPTQTDMRRAERHLGPCSWDDRSAALAVAPTPLVCQTKWPAGPSGWPLAHPLFAALDLASDRGRGREVLAKWKPKGVRVVWR